MKTKTQAIILSILLGFSVSALFLAVALGANELFGSFFYSFIVLGTIFSVRIAMEALNLVDITRAKAKLQVKP